MRRQFAATAALLGMALGGGVAIATPAQAADINSISGAITLPAGAPGTWLSDVVVVATGPVTRTASASTGTFALNDLPDGMYKVHAYATNSSVNVIPEYFGGSYYASGASGVSVSGGTNYLAANIDLDFGGYVRGTLFYAGTLPPADWNGVKVTAFGPSGTVSTTAGSDGKYTFSQLIPGAYTFRVDPQEYVGSEGPTTPSVASKYLFGLGMDEPGTIGIGTGGTGPSQLTSAVIYEAFTLSGTVEIEGVDDPERLGQITVSVPNEYYITPPSTTVDPDTGAWSLVGLPRVTMYVRFSGPGVVTEWFDNKGTRGGAVAFPTGPGDNSLGHVVLASGQSVSGTVSLSGSFDRDDLMDSLYVQFSNDTYTSELVSVDPVTGEYTSSPLPVGDYLVRFASQYSQHVATEFYDDVYEPERATLVNVTADAPVTGINAVLKKLRHYYSTPTPTISGTKGLGETLTAKPGAWSPAPTSFTYQWYRNGAAISGATKSTYKLTSSDSKMQISVKVTGVKAGYEATSKTSAKVTMPTFFTKAPAPTISGTLRSGYTLTAKAGTWSPKPTLSYQWYRDGKAISKATKSTYKLTASDKGKKITVKVTAKKSGYGTHAKTSAAKTIYKEFSKSPNPTISGTAKAGKTLTAKVGTWSPTPTSFSYQWYRNGSKISGATKATYKLTSSDKGKKITVKVKPKLSGYYAPTKTSKAKTIAK